MAHLALCRWCGKRMSSDHSLLCSNCGKPSRLFGYIVVCFSFVLANLLLPLIIGVATFFWSTQQEKSSSDIANRRKLAEAYVDYGNSQTDLRRAIATIELLDRAGSDNNISAPDLRKAVLDYDAAFNALGIKLAPFEEVARRTEYYTRGNPNGTSALVETWHRCYIVPYHGAKRSLATEKAYWSQIKSYVRQCTADSCPRNVANHVSLILWNIFSGTCLCAKPETQRPLTWFYEELQSIMVEHDIHQDVAIPGGRNLAPANSDLLKGANPYCDRG